MSEIILVALFLILPLVGNAAEDPRPDMQVMASEITSIERFLLSESDFKNSVNDSSLKHSMLVLSTHLEHLSKGTFAEKPALKVNLDLLRQHVSDAQRAFNEGNKSYSRYMLQSSLQMCIACHTRGKSLDMNLPDADLSKANQEERAEFLFATRQFEKGRVEYEKIIDGYPGNHAGLPGVHKAMVALAVYFARIKEDPKGGEAYFEKLSANEALPIYVKNQAKAWSHEFQSWSKEKKADDSAKLTESQLVAKAKKLVKTDDFSLIDSGDKSFHVRRLRASALLHRALESPGAKSPAKGEALYLLGQIYHRIDSSLFFRFGEMYLKACVREYPKTAIARSCYVALEQSVSEGYTGSGGTDVPEDEQVELLTLKRLAF